MTAVTARERVDERVVGAGTTARFALLVVLLLVSSGGMVSAVITGFTGADRFDGLGCLLAAGADPLHGTDLANALSTTAQIDAFDACLSRYHAQAPWWSVMGSLALLAILVGVLFRVLPAWRARPGRVVPLAAVDRDARIRLALDELAAVAGLACAPRYVVDPAATSSGAVVFGSNRRPTVCLHGGLLARRVTDPDRFRAVVLHELAHIRNGDVTLTYATVSAWRVFVVLVLLPFLAYLAALVVDQRSPLRVVDAPVMTRDFLRMILLVALVYLARADVLRSREIYADLAAARWGAHPSGWAVPAPDPARNGLRRALGSFAELWRTHPRWDLRRDALTDPGALFGVRALPMFLTGVTAELTNSQASTLFSRLGLTGEWLDLAMSLAAAALVTGVAGTAMWRGVTYALLTTRRVPSGVRAGLWLGAGMAAGALVLHRVATVEWVPAHPEVLLLAVLAGTAFGWWTTQCAHVWAGVWRGPTIRPVMLVCLAAACLALAAWFQWWVHHGSGYATGWQLDPGGNRRWLEQVFPGPAGEHIPELSAIAVVWPVLTSLNIDTLVLAAAAVVWVVPLVAWAVSSTGDATSWTRRVLVEVDGASTPGAELPPLRRVLKPALLGVLLSVVAAVAVQAYLHSWQPPPHERWGL